MSSRRLVEITQDLLPTLRQLHLVLFPVSYSSAYFAHAVQNDVCRLLQDQRGEYVGVLVCRIERDSGGKTSLYIMTLGVLAPSRDRGLGSELLAYAEHCAGIMGCQCVYLHVQEGNSDAIAWYMHRGFAIVGRIEHYYRKITPDSALVLAKDACPLELV